MSIVDRDVALTVRVTDSPKKLKPLSTVRLNVLAGRLGNNSPRKERERGVQPNLPNTDHDEDARDRK